MHAVMCLHRYLTAVMGRLVSPGGHVMGVEKWPDLAERSVNNIRVRGQACVGMWRVELGFN